MATEVVTGTMKLAKRIEDDARADAKATLQQAEESIAAIRAENERKLVERSADFAAKRESAVKSVLDGCKTRAELDGRKQALSKKRAVIDRVFDETYTELLSLSGEGREKVLRAMLQAEAEDGDVVVPAAKDREAMQKLVAGFTGAKVTLGSDNADIEGGFTLVNGGYEKDCSFTALLNDLRGSLETDVAKLLFSSEGGQS